MRNEIHLKEIQRKKENVSNLHLQLFQLVRKTRNSDFLSLEASQSLINDREGRNCSQACESFYHMDGSYNPYMVSWHEIGYFSSMARWKLSEKNANLGPSKWKSYQPLFGMEWARRIRPPFLFLIRKKGMVSFY